MTTLPIPVMDAAAQRDLATAHALLESPGVAAQLANALGASIESLMTKRLPKMVTRSIDGVTRRALQVAMTSALLSLRSKTDAQQPASTARHTLAVAVAGGAGGFLGLPGLMVELPVTTTVMLRSIADIARAEGESLHDPETALACLEVLAHGGRSASDDGAESGYFAVRAAMAQQLSAAASYVAAHGFASKGAPALVALVSRVAAKFSVNVGENSPCRPCRWSARSVAPRSIPCSCATSRRWRAGISSCAAWSAASAKMRCGARMRHCCRRGDADSACEPHCVRVVVVHWLSQRRHTLAQRGAGKRQPHHVDRTAAVARFPRAMWRKHDRCR